MKTTKESQVLEMNHETVYKMTALKRERRKIFPNNMIEIITTF